MNYEAALLLLETEIKKQAADLKAYAAREGSNERFIEMRNRTIQILTEVYNGLLVPNGQLLQDLGREMERLLAQDPHLSGFNIRIIISDSGYPGFIQCYWR